MNYTKNKKIEQVKETTMIVGIDVVNCKRVENKSKLTCSIIKYIV